MVNRVDFKTGFKCNNRCVFCVQGDKRNTVGNYNKEELFKKLTDARQNSDSIVFTGGETTIHPSFLDLVREAKRLGFVHIQVQTNGRMFARKEFVRDVVAAGANEFNPSLHGHTAEIHDQLTDAPGSFNQVLLGIKTLKTMGQRVITNSVITKSNFSFLPELAQLLAALKVDQMQFAFVHILGTAAEQYQQVVPKKSEVAPFVHKAIDIAKSNKIPVFTEAIPFCFMQGYEEAVVEAQIPITKIFDEQIIENYTEYRWNEGKVKGPPCQTCAKNADCEGPWKEYPELFGWDEFKPVSQK